MTCFALDVRNLAACVKAFFGGGRMVVDGEVSKSSIGKIKLLSWLDTCLCITPNRRSALMLLLIFQWKNRVFGIICSPHSLFIPFLDCVPQYEQIKTTGIFFVRCVKHTGEIPRLWRPKTRGGGDKVEVGPASTPPVETSSFDGRFSVPPCIVHE
jgi:hypothetical protein